MTVSSERLLAKRSAGDEAATALQSVKKLRVLEPIQPAQHAASATLSAAGTVGFGASLLNNSVKALKKRSRVDGVLLEACCTSPPAGKRGKLFNGSNTALVCPHASAAALEELLTCEGLEKDPDLAVEQAYISRQLQQREATQQQVSFNASRVSAEAPLAAACSSDVAERRQDRDAAKGSRGRDQTQQNRNRDQLQQYRSRPAIEVLPERARSPTPGFDDEDEDYIKLDLVPDKEWQRLFAVLTLSAPKQGDSAQQTPGSHQRSSRAWVNSNTSRPTGAAASSAAAPVTPSRNESEVPRNESEVATGHGAVTPTRRSFLANEFSRVQARLTPERELARNQHGSATEVIG